MLLAIENEKMASLSLVLIILSFPLLLLLFLRKHKPNLPPGPKGLPIIGNLHQLDSSALYLDLWNLSKKYGPLFSLMLGHRNVLIVSSPKMAKETLKNNDTAFSNRPSFFSQKKLSYNGIEIIFSPYGDYWREIRKICTIHIFSARRVSSFSSMIREDEVRRMIRKISGHVASNKATNLNELVVSLTGTIICRVAFGRRYEEEGVETSRFHGMMNELQELMASFFLSDYIHFTGWIDRLRGLNSRLEKNFKELDEFYQEVIDAHLDPKRPKPRKEEEDIIDVFLDLMNQQCFSVDLTFDHLKGLLMDFLAGGIDTSSAISVWAMTELMKNPRVMHKVQEEVRNMYGQKGFIEEGDIQKLTYLKAVVKEIMRLHPPAPLLVPKETSKKSIIQGFEIPAKTLVYVNAWAIHRDPEVWKDPEMFYPERFLENDIDFKGQDTEFIPFGAGRRICPGLLMGQTTVELILANLVYSFDWEMPPGTKREDIDFEVLTGIVTHKKNPLHLVAKNYLPSL